MKITRPALVRIHQIAAALNCRKRVSSSELAGELEVCRKTIDRDLAFMRDQLRLPVETDRCGYYFAARVHLCPVCAHRIRVKKCHV